MKFTPKIVDEFLRRIAIDGRSARSIGKDKDMPSYEAFYYLKNRDPEVQQRYLQAMEARATAIDDRIDEVLAEVKAGTMDYQAGRLEIDTQKWRMAKFFPRLYGEQTQRIEVEHKASFVDELKRVQEAVQQRKMLDAKVVEGKAEVKSGVGSDEVDVGENRLTASRTRTREQTENKQAD